MKKSIFTFLLILFALSFHLQAQHTVTLAGISFSPDNLTINVGETVTWDNVSGVHNVNGSVQSYPGNPEGFNSGSPESAPWMYSHTFNVPGTYDYHCDLHFGVGMTGQITVVGAPAADDIIITEINYNNPGSDDYEFLELYNNGADSVDMTDWVLSSAVDFTFPAFTLHAGEYVVVANNALTFEAAFGFLPFQFNGALNNTGEDVILSDASGTQIDIVPYSASSPWPTQPNGTGPTLSLCDVSADNSDPANWAPAITPTGVVINGTEILATPGAANECPAGPIIEFMFNGFNVLENAGTVFATLLLSNGNANTTEVTLEMNGLSTATPGDDFMVTLPQTVTFDAGVSLDTQIVAISIVDDSDVETTELLIIDMVNPTNGATITQNGGQYSLSILDDDAPITEALVITGVFDTQVESGGTWAKGVELQAIDTIPDLSVFGVGAANNGGGSSGVETGFPAISLSAGDCIYVANDSVLFFNFFGIYPTATGDAANINGDDAIELFENNIVIDVFGEINTDGTGEPWEYLDGWAYRKSGTGPDGSNFILNNWTFSGINAFDNVPDNASAPTPFPTCTYSPIAPTMPVANDDNANTDINVGVTVNVLGNDVTPNQLTSMTVVNGPDNGNVTVNGLSDISYTPNLDFCGIDAFTYEICDMNGCDQAVVTINVACPTSYPAYSIGTVTTVDAEGSPDSLGVTCQLQGIVHGIDFQGNDNIQFVLIDNTGGISVFSANNFGYTVTEGDEMIIQGTISEFSCLTQITPDTLWVVSTGNDLETPDVTAFLNESFESELVQLTNLNFVDPGEWLGDGSSFNVRVTNGTFTSTMRIDNDSELSSMPIPSEPFHAIGLGSQFDNSGPCDMGYQFLPRYAADIIELSATVDPSLGERINYFPNPVSDVLTINTDLEIDRIMISNLLGQVMLEQQQSFSSLSVGDLRPGVYLITFQVGDSIWTSKLVKE